LPASKKKWTTWEIRQFDFFGECAGVNTRASEFEVRLIHQQEAVAATKEEGFGKYG
jgi:hypothetical protein